MSLSSKIKQSFQHIQQQLICPISQQKYVQPFVAKDGNSYQQDDFKQWLQQKSISPLTRQQLGDTYMYPNRVLIKVIQAVQKEKSQILSIIQKQQSPQPEIKKIQLQNSSMYQGQCFDGQPHGKGVEIHKNYQYRGFFSKGAKHGKGIIQVKSKGIIYKGQWKNNFYHGQGQLKKIQKGKVVYRYSGYWKNGKKEGKGVEIDLQKDTVYEGNFINNKKEDENGKLTIKKSGTVYNGGFKNDLYHGLGKFISKGKHFQGQFLNGKANGQCLLVTEQGRKLKNYYKDGKII